MMLTLGKLPLPLRTGVAAMQQLGGRHIGAPPLRVQVRRQRRNHVGGAAVVVVAACSIARHLCLRRACY
jgi:hypothetical protein